MQSSVFKEKHSEGNIWDALAYIGIMPQILVVDIDGASGKEQSNRKLIKKIGAMPYYNFYGVGGGIRSV